MFHYVISQQFVFGKNQNKTRNICAKFDTDNFIFNLCDRK